LLVSPVECSYLNTYTQVWIIAKRWKQSPVGRFLERLQKTKSLYL